MNRAIRHPLAPAFTLEEWLKEGRLLMTARREVSQVESALAIVNLMLGLGLEADAHNPLLEAKGLLEANLEELGFVDLEEEIRAINADYLNDCRRNDSE